MDFEKLANEFIKQHEGVGYQSQPQIVAVRAFAKWLSENASQQSVQLTCSNCGGKINTSSGYRICENGCGGESASN